MTVHTGLKWATGQPWTRRQWLMASAALVLAVERVSRPARADAVAGKGDEADAAIEAAVKQRAREAGLSDFGMSRTEHYLAIGDAREGFRDEALAICERLAASYRRHFTDKGLPAVFPPRRLTVVALAGRTSYQAFKGEEIPEAESGHYDIDADRLVIFDAQGPGAVPRGVAGRRINTLSLVHEAIHQLTFDTGLVAREADVPVALSEGLATYGELWTRDQPRFGQLNRPRLLALRDHDWLPVEELLTDDTLFEQPDRAQSAYSIAWLMVYTLLRTKAAKFRAYLDLVRTRKDATHRSADAASAFGDLERLDRELKKQARNNL